MALQLAQEQESGISGDYWKIENITMIGEGQSRVKISLYKDSAARLADKAAIKSVIYIWENADNPLVIADMDLVDSNPFKLSYDKLKTLDEFDGAIDV